MQDLLAKIEKKDKASLAHLRQTYNYARNNLSNIKRRTGESYFQHGCEVALTLEEVSQEPALIATAISHDLLVPEDGASLLASSFLTNEEKILVERMHDLRRLRIDEKTKDLDQFIAAFTHDPRLLILRMAHRLNDVRKLKNFSSTSARQVANESLHMYAAIAGRLGFHTWRHEMEDACFKFLKPAAAKELEAKFERFREIDLECLNQTKDFIQKLLRERGIKADIDYRLKPLYSTYRKMLLKKRRFRDLTDRLAIRIVVEGNEEDCYRVLAAVHKAMHPIPGKLKDYIGSPKENGYRSIHTVIFPLPGVTEQPMEIQIRTVAMHESNEKGIAAHGNYKEWLYSLKTRSTKVDLFRNLEVLRKHSRSPAQFSSALRNYFSEERLIVFDQNNNLYHLPKPCSVLDFICNVYAKKSLKAKAVKLNGKMDSIDTVLSDGDVVEVFFAKSLQVTQEWFGACKLASSRSLIKAALAGYN